MTPTPDDPTEINAAGDEPTGPSDPTESPGTESPDEKAGFLGRMSLRTTVLAALSLVAAAGVAGAMAFGGGSEVDTVSTEGTTPSTTSTVPATTAAPGAPTTTAPAEGAPAGDCADPEMCGEITASNNCDDPEMCGEIEPSGECNDPEMCGVIEPSGECNDPEMCGVITPQPAEGGA